MKKILVSMLTVTMALAACRALVAQESKPVLTVVFSGYDNLKRDVEFLGKLGNNAGLADLMDAMLKQQTQGEGLAGIDTSKPWGLVVYGSDSEAKVQGLIPVAALDKTLGLLEKFGIEAKDAGDGVKEIQAPNKSLYVKADKGWACIADKAESAKNLPADPQAAFAGLEKKYLIAIRGSVKNLPAKWKSQAMDLLRMGMMMSMQNMGEGNDDMAKMADMNLKQIDQMLNELDELTVGLALDQQSSSLKLDLELTALPGTKLAQQFAKLKDGKTNFAGFDLPGAAVVFQQATTLTDEDLAQVKTMLAAYRSRVTKSLEEQGLGEPELKTAKQMVADIFDALEKTAENRQFDAGLTVLLKPGAATLVVGGLMLDTGKLEGVLKQLVNDLAKEQADIGKLVKFDAETYEGLRFHVASIPIPEEDEDAKKVTAQVGNPLEIVLAAGDKALYLAVGRDAAKAIKQVVDKSKAEPGKTIPPGRMTISAGVIAKFVAAVADDEPQVKGVATMIGAMLDQSGGKDHITITSTGIPNGSKAVIEIEKGILQILPTLAPKGPPAGAAGPGANPF